MSSTLICDQGDQRYIGSRFIIWLTGGIRHHSQVLQVRQLDLDWRAHGHSIKPSPSYRVVVVGGNIRLSRTIDGEPRQLMQLIRHHFRRVHVPDSEDGVLSRQRTLHHNTGPGLQLFRPGTHIVRRTAGGARTPRASRAFGVLPVFRGSRRIT